ncbi:MAG: phage virion morphogenesis protein [Candidatus Gastranaerophilales bacterium]|nr:phage virion morphogenesis protein [Candidatus Gastranaerophilales bacterium]
MKKQMQSTSGLIKYNNSTVIASNLDYAAIYQLGGRAGGNESVLIPARPYLQLTDEDFNEIFAKIENFFKSLLKN